MCDFRVSKGILSGPDKMSINTVTGSPSSALLPTFLGEGSPTKIDYRRKCILILTSLLEEGDLLDLADLLLVFKGRPDFGDLQPHKTGIRREKASEHKKSE